MESEMSDEKVPRPTLWNVWQCYGYKHGLTNDSSGLDAVNLFGMTATPEEMAKLEKEAYWLGFLVGMGLGYVAVNALFRLFGDRDRTR